MNINLKKFKVTPAVVMADTESVVTIESLDGSFKFYDDIVYEVSYFAQDESDVPIDEELSLLGYNKNRKTYQVRPENGKIKLKYFFSGEQEWRIHISTKEYKKYENPLYDEYIPYWNQLINLPKDGIDVRIYSLKEDLYKRQPLRGDLHVHTTASDGWESPEFVCAGYRKCGRDFVAITDHNVFYASREAEEKLNFLPNFQILKGEEVHNGYVGFFHMVNIGGDYGVNDIYIKEPQRVKDEIAELEKEIEVPKGLDKNEYLGRVWMYREIKKSGGYAIHVHPYWNIGFYHTSTNMSKAIIKNGLCDAYEIIGGVEPKENNMQVALYNDLRAEGIDIPIVGSTDSHSVLSGGHLKRSTVVFSKDDIIKSIDEGYSTAVESLQGENIRAYGKLRLVTYTHFLLENYFPLHDELCEISGRYLEEYVHGNDKVKDLIVQTEEKISEFKKEFFGY